MKGKIIRFIKVVLICSLCLTAFIMTGVIYLDKNTDFGEVNQEVSSVPYYTYYPQNSGIIFERGTEKTFFYLDFKGETISVIFDIEGDSTDDEIYGYRVDYEISIDNELFVWIIDTLGGLEFGDLRYTGIQTVEMLCEAEDYRQKKREIILKILEKIGEVGLSRGDLLYIIEESETNLTVPDCYYWFSYLKKVCSFVKTVN